MNQGSNIDSDAIYGAGSDASPEQRPGIPMEMEPPRPMGNAHWATPARQPDPGGILKRKGLDELTPVFGVTTPPRGLSGLLRRGAYAIPEHFTSHWLLLLFADRIDVLESRLRKPAVLLPLLALGAAGVALAVREERKPFWKRWR